ncbi:MAG: hypothetical protein ABSG15_02865, partial [FCB group bacterium]
SFFVILLSSNYLLAQSNFEKFRKYKDRYKVECAGEKITDNHGNGFDSLYGTRNMRTILYGVAYRGGANNFYHKINKRDNHNPLPEDGLMNLCGQGFSTAVYLYGTNFSESKKLFVNKATNDTLRYIQNSGSERKKLKEIMLIIKDVIDDPQKGPVYLHCWNGWHQSGYISAAILIQFCKISNEQALQYWIYNTDGVNKGYDNVKQLVKNFKPFVDLKIDESVRKAICPCMKK